MSDAHLIISRAPLLHQALTYRYLLSLSTAGSYEILTALCLGPMIPDVTPQVWLCCAEGVEHDPAYCICRTNMQTWRGCVSDGVMYCDPDIGMLQVRTSPADCPRCKLTVALYLPR